MQYGFYKSAVLLPLFIALKVVTEMNTQVCFAATIHTLVIRAQIVKDYIEENTWKGEKES